ncbi:MAG: ERMES complex subunit [Watsoniomyces obsoletus]|nr:MAG: ERMES complex subunit [Watsoniomyces obsoletus]
MAFRFNWSPLTADAGFYDRARELLTTALNKSPKPPIIVDDILVSELNLGSVPPELEILEVGDLADDRFRGIFKMCYSGDAFLTLKTRVQANPLNTYLSTKPSFTSPRPLAAASGLTIPIQISLSDIRLSAFIILVFSKQKGLTLVFRNDPLESLKVSSSFDSIPFVRDYLQKEIDGQLRYLLMEELPAIIHRLSLRLWGPDQAFKEEERMAKSNEAAAEQAPIDPLASPLQEPVEMEGDYSLDSFEPLSSPVDAHRPSTPSLFSQKNLIRLAALNNSHRTLSLFTPSIRDAVFRAWAGASERGDAPGANTPATPHLDPLSRSHSYSGSASSGSVFSDHAHSSRPSLTSFHSSMSGVGLAGMRHARGHAARRGKSRVVNLRRKAPIEEETVSSTATASSTPPPPPPEMSSSVTSWSGQTITEEREDELVTPPTSPKSKRISGGERRPELRPVTPTRASPGVSIGGLGIDQGTQTSLPERVQSTKLASSSLRSQTSYPSEKPSMISQPTTIRNDEKRDDRKEATPPTMQWGILERALMAKLANDIHAGSGHGIATARQQNIQPTRFSDMSKHSMTMDGHDDVGEREEGPPPAYEVR